MDLSFRKINIKPNVGLIIMLLLFLVVAFETYTLFNHIYRGFYSEEVVLPSDNILRVNSSGYKNTIDFLNNLEEYKVTPADLSNPFVFRK